MTTPHPSPSTVLVVDDNPATRYATARVLRAAGFEVSEAATGGEALQRANGQVSAVVLDVHLPDIDGFEVCRQLRERADTARVPVIHLSAAYVRDDDKVRGLRSGADAYITHPVEPALLVATIHALMRARTAEDGMRRSEARFRAIFDHALSGICLIDREGRFTDLNPGMVALLQRPREAVIGRKVADFAPAQWAERIGLYLDKSHQGVWREDFPLLDATGREVQLEWSLSAHLEPGTSLAVVTDISERAALAEQREHLLEREQAARATAERLSRSKDEFIAVLSHELRTPLNAMLGWVHVLRRSGASPELMRGLEGIERNAKTQARLISDLLDMSSIDLGKLRLELQPVAPREIVLSAVTALSATSGDKNLQVEADLDAAPAVMMADPARLQQIVWNLLTNAIKFSHPGGRIRVGLGVVDQDMVLTVQDEGQGIRADFLPFMFDRFSQSDSSSNRLHGGLGLGLSIVRQLAELHGGSVVAHSDGPGHGARFTVRLPLQHSGSAQAAAQDPDAPRAGDSGHPQADLTGVEVLVVEDDDEARQMLSMILRDRGAQVRVARDVDGALAQLRTRRPSVLVCDIGLPGKDGYALARELRAQEAGGSHLPAVALTAFARAKDKDSALLAGFDVHCAKPLQPNELIAAIARLVR